MKAMTMNTPQAEALDTNEPNHKTFSAYKTIRELFRMMTSEAIEVPHCREQNLLDENMGPEIRRLRW